MPTYKFDEEYRKYLDSIDPLLLQERIDHFRNLNFSNLSYEEIGKEINYVISFESDGQTKAIFMRGNAVYPKNTMFYRARELPDDDHFTPLRTVRFPKDVWNPPKEIVKMQRLNKDNESLLYTSPINPNIAIGELRLDENRNFVLAVFEAISEIKVCSIANFAIPFDLSSEQKLKHLMINDFLRHEFIRDVGKGTEYLYRISEIIAKSYFDLPEIFQDAWCYPSIVKKEYVNVCFRESKAKEKLKLNGIILCKRTNSSMNVFNCLLVGITRNENSEFEYYKIGSDEQKRFFPEICSE